MRAPRFLHVAHVAHAVHVACVAQVALAVLVPAAALAQPAPPAPPAGPGAAPGDLDRAKDLFRRGNELLKANDNEAALELFLKSRALVPSVPNTMNAAIALDRLARADEALELYEALLTEFGPRMEEDDKRAVAAAMADLKKRVGSLDVSSNVEGTLVVDGRKRGTVPLTSPVKVLPGKHIVRVLRDGYAPGEAIATVTVGQAARVDVRLEALAASGRLAVTDDAAAPGVDVLVDGAPVGPAPWQGVLAPGRHVVSLRGKDVGTGPMVANVVVGQVVPLRLRSVPVGPPLRIEPEPNGATVTIDGVLVGAGAWDGRLPLGGMHTIEVADEGYQTKHVHLDGSQRGVVRVALSVDESHPRWKAGQRAHIRADALFGLGFGAGLSGDASRPCPSACTEVKSPRAYLLGARAGYQLPSGLTPEIGVGYAHIASSLTRTIATGEGYDYRFDDAITVDGPYVSGGLSWRLPIGNTFHVAPRVTIGAFFARSKDTVEGDLVRTGEKEPVRVDGSGKSVRGLDFFAMPELSMGVTIGSFHLGAGLGVALFLVDAPKLPLGDTSVKAPCNQATTPGTVPLCGVASSRVIASEQAYQRFTLWMPQLAAGWTF